MVHYIEGFIDCQCSKMIIIIETVNNKNKKND